MNSQIDNSLGDFDQTLEHRKATTCCSHNEAKQEIHGSDNIVSGTGNVCVHQHHYHNEEDEEDACKHYEKLINRTPYWLLTLEFAVVSILFFYKWNQQILSGNINQGMIFKFILIAETVLLGFLWLLSADHELFFLKCHLGKFLPGKEEISPNIISYIVPFSIIILLFTANYIHIYAFIFWIYTCFDVFARNTATRLVYDAVKRAAACKSINDAIKNIYSYYIENNFEIRGYFFGSVFLSVFLVGTLTDGLIDILYIVVIGNIALSEMVIFSWRRPFYDYMKKIKKESIDSEMLGQQ